MKQALMMEELVTKHAEVMDKYDPQKKVAMFVDEWGGWYEVEPGTNGAFLYQQNTLRDAMIAGTTLNTFNNHCERVKMANLAQAINVLQAVILTKDAQMILTPTYHVMEMYNVHQEATMLPLQVISEDYTLGNEKLKAVSASASKDKNGAIHISLVNIDTKQAKNIKLDLKGNTAKTISGKILTSDKIQNHNTFDNPNRVAPTTFSGAILSGDNVELTLPPFSVVVLELR
jgi:alpha-N-arabinofuranosidase